MLSLICCLLYKVVLAQGITYTDTNYTFIITLDTSWNEQHSDYDVLHIKSVDVFNRSMDLKLQTIIPRETFLMGNFESELFRMEDVNFDGIKDFRLLSDCPFHWQNRHYLFYVLDPVINQFTMDTVLNEMYFGSPEFDPVTKNIHSNNVEGSQEYTNYDYHYENGIISIVEQNSTLITDNANIKTKYKWINGKLTEVERIELEEIDDKKGWIRYTKYELVNDEMKITKKKNYKGSIDDLPY